MSVFWQASILQPVILTLICMFVSTMCDDVEFTSVGSDRAICPSATPVSSARSDIECSVACTGNPNCRAYGYATPFVEGSCLVTEIDNCILMREGKTFMKSTLTTGTTVMFMQRYVGDVSFAKPWTDYENGFGNRNGDFWLGLRNIRNLLGPVSATWRVEMKRWNGELLFLEYSDFTVGDSSTNYTMNYAELVNKSSSIENNMIDKNVSFSTMDRDNDKRPASSCSQAFSGNGGFWFGNCGGAHLTAVIPSAESTASGFTRLMLGPSIWASLKEIRFYLQR